MASISSFEDPAGRFEPPMDVVVDLFSVDSLAPGTNVFGFLTVPMPFVVEV